MIVVGCLNVFECEETIGLTLKSIEPFVDRIIVVDGAYEGFSDHIRSKDGTMTKVKGFPKPKILIGNSTNHCFRDEMKKRNLYMDFLDPGEWALIIDGDQYISGGVEETLALLREAKEPWYSVTSYAPRSPRYGGFEYQGEWVRLIRYVKGMKYVDNHFTIQCPDGSKVPLKATCTPLRIIHDHRFRSEAYEQAMKRYNDTVRPLKEKREWPFS